MEDKAISIINKKKEKFIKEKTVVGLITGIKTETAIDRIIKNKKEAKNMLKHVKD